MVEHEDREQASKDTSAKSREVRLGVVMYGGVSLAIYIYGVAHELFRAVRGRGVYRLVKAITDSDVIVDVVSGTSAGGINGILLSYALCNEREFGAVSSLWRDHGDIETLLRSPSSRPEECLSLLDSRGVYLPALQGAFDRLAASPCPRRPDEDASRLEELDLFVTGTHVAGRVYTTFDDAGHAIDVKDHRTVFWLKHRAGRKEPLNPRSVANVDSAITHGALAKLAAITSCFPVAFEPIQVTAATPGETTVDGKLQRWGQIGGAAYFLDGGVLDNKPFTSTLGAIFSRAADREVERQLFYVEPDPERFAQVADQGGDGVPRETAPPTAPQAAIAALIGIPGYESIANDLKLLAGHNSKVERYNRLLERLQPSALRPAVAGEQSSTADEVESPNYPGEAIYVQTRLVALSERVVIGLLRQKGNDQPLQGEQRTRARALVEAFDQLVANPGNANWLDGARAILADFDVYFRERRAVRIVYLLYERLHPEPGKQALADGLRPAYRCVLHAFNRQLKLYEIVRRAMESLVDDGPFDWMSDSADALWQEVQTAFAYLLHQDAEPAKHVRAHAEAVGDRWEDWLPQRVLTELNDLFRSQSARCHEALAGRNGVQLPSPFQTMFGDLEGVEERILEVIPDPGDPVRRAYAEFRDVDARLYPVQLFGNLGETDVVRTVRISPWDAQTAFSARPMADKLSGDAFHHFGGFFKRSWRSNDIMWGRLDGTCQLLECLVTVSRLERIGEDDALRPLVRERLAKLELKQLFPGGGDRARAELGAWLEKLVGEDKVSRAEARGDFAPMRALLIEAAQREILGEEVPNVIQDALLEQSRWNSYRADTTAPPAAAGGTWDADAWRFMRADGAIDPLVAMTAAAEIARTSLGVPDASDDGAVSPSATRLGRFFSEYRVGAEELQRDVPTVVLLGVLSRALLVVRSCLLQAMGTKRAAVVRRSAAYQLFINTPMRAFDGSVRLVRAVPSAWTPLKLGLLGLAVVALVAGTATHWREMVSGLFAIGAYVVAPLVVLWGLVQIFFAERRGGRRATVRNTVAARAPTQPGGANASGRDDPPRLRIVPAAEGHEARVRNQEDSPSPRA